ncbi:MAG: glutamate--tRNA ligase [Oscillospiraceae bacterium]|nr:glutamate--tRNA ligase [Oscillospiraceae bacterium]
MDFLKLSNLLFPGIKESPEYYEEKYPPRNLPEGAKVTRFAPSPTGFMHIGNIYSSFVDFLVAKPEGVFYLRIEDTDQKREVEGGIEKILSGLASLDIFPSEGPAFDGGETGAYGPYKQRGRCEIYRCFANELVKKGFAYPCFCTEEELGALRENQEKDGENPGYYGKWANCREMNFAAIENNIKNGRPYVLRLRSDGDENKKIVVEDLIKGKLEMPENTQDIVLLKTDGIPTYHFAHAVDDHLMRTTHVIRGDDWVSSLPIHIQLFRMLGFKPPKYAQYSNLMKMDGASKRKLSKRKDPEAAVSFYFEQGYPKESLIEYLLTIMNSNFEDWRRANRNEIIDRFPFALKKMSPSGALFDLAKLNDISKTVISLMPADEVYQNALNWAKEYDEELFALFSNDPDYAKAILAIDRDVPKPRKDIERWGQVKDYLSYFYESLFAPCRDLPENISKADADAIIKNYMEVYDESDGKEGWFNKIKSICGPLGFSPDVKEYKKNPESYKGHVGDVSSVIRAAATGRLNTPDLYEIMKLLGKDRLLKRLETFL